MWRELFVGAGGELFNRIIAAIGLRREQVYMLNVIKCRPPQNRNPSQRDCGIWPILQEQLACLRPLSTARRLCGPDSATNVEKISRLRGRFHRLGDIQVMPTYIPCFCYAIRSIKELSGRTCDLRSRPDIAVAEPTPCSRESMRSQRDLEVELDASWGAKNIAGCVGFVMFGGLFGLILLVAVGASLMIYQQCGFATVIRTRT